MVGVNRQMRQLLTDCTSIEELNKFQNHFLDFPKIVLKLTLETSASSKKKVEKYFLVKPKN